MRLVSTLIVLLALPCYASAQDTPSREAGVCLSDRDMREALSEKRVVAPIAAVRAARASARGDALRARLCQQGDDLVYIVTVLGKDGKIVVVNIDGRSGRPLDR